MTDAARLPSTEPEEASPPAVLVVGLHVSRTSTIFKRQQRGDGVRPEHGLGPLMTPPTGLSGRGAFSWRFA
jgi:hypothetical protein